MRKVPLSPDVEPRVIARGTPGFSGADLANLVNEAALLAARIGRRLVTMAEFEAAKDKVMMGAERRSMVMSEDEKRLTAYPRGRTCRGRAHVPKHDPLHKITIIPRGRALRTGNGATGKTVAPVFFAGIALAEPVVMGILNVTPDSFSDGGDVADPAVAIVTGIAMRDAGAAILDVGGESTRPGSDPVSVEEELRRVIPVIRGLAAAGGIVSIDTRHGAVMRAAIEAGARIVNDVTALTGDRESLAVVAGSSVSVVLMHMQGEPKTMQAAPRYDDVVREVRDYLGARIAACEAAGIDRSRIAIDPGIGFGKALEHNLRLLNELDAFGALGCTILIGVSRKSFISRAAGETSPKARLGGSLAAALAAVDRGARIVRAHDVPETVQALRIRAAIRRAGT
jgi:dihydropteroate synthase